MSWTCIPVIRDRWAASARARSSPSGREWNSSSRAMPVVGLAPASFASYATTLAEFVAAKPEHLSFEEAATIPICFLTVQHALRRLGRMQPGERVLIHAASGGVGLAAIQIARQVGAEIFATAGSPRKREYLRSLGIQHVMDSRTLDFADQIREATGGEGIDLVLNSLTGETIAASLSVLRQGGRFLELGKTDLWDQPRVDAFRPGVTFFAIALDQMMAQEPQAVGEPAGRSAPAVRRQDAPTASLADVPHAAGRRCPAAHGPGRAYRQGRHPGGGGKRTGQAGADPPRGRHVSDHRRAGRAGTEAGPVARRSRGASPGPAGPLRRVRRRPARSSTP